MFLWIFSPGQTTPGDSISPRPLRGPVHGSQPGAQAGRHVLEAQRDGIDCNEPDDSVAANGTRWQWVAVFSEALHRLSTNTMRSKRQRDGIDCNEPDDSVAANGTRWQWVAVFNEGLHRLSTNTMRSKAISRGRWRSPPRSLAAAYPLNCGVVSSPCSQPGARAQDGIASRFGAVRDRIRLLR